MATLNEVLERNGITREEYDAAVAEERAKGGKLGFTSEDVINALSLGPAGEALSAGGNVAFRFLRGLGTGGALGSATEFGHGAFRAIGKAQKPKISETLTGKVRVPEKTVQRVAALTGRKISDVRNELSMDKMQKINAKALRTGWEKLLDVGRAGTPFTLIAAGITGAATISTWAAFDNVIQNGAIQSNSILNNVIFNELSFDDALEEMNNIQKNFEVAESTVNVGSLLNPFLWGYRSTYKVGIDQNRDAIARNKGILEKKKEEQELGEGLGLSTQISSNDIIQSGLDAGKTLQEIAGEESARQQLGIFTEEEKATGLSQATAGGEGPSALIKDPVTGQTAERSTVQFRQDKRKTAATEAEKRRIAGNKPRTSGGFSGVRQSNIARGSTEKKIKGVV